MEIFITYYKEIIALIGSLTGFLGLAITFYYKYRDSNIKDRELELKKVQFELDKQHQITKETYQHMFKKKILLYKDLNDQLILYKNRLHNIGIEITFGYKESEIVSEESITMPIFRKILELLETNIFFVSKDLEQIFRNINDNYKKALFGFEYDRQLGVYGHYEELEEAEFDNSNFTFYKEHKDDVISLFNQIENEIAEIKQHIGLI
jgi:hypothetical protein